MKQLSSFGLVVVFAFFFMFLLQGCRPIIAQEEGSPFPEYPEDNSTQTVNELTQLSKFAIDEHNKKSTTEKLTLTKLISAKVSLDSSGEKQYLVFECTNNSGQFGVYDATVLLKRWLNFKQLLEFKKH